MACTARPMRLRFAVLCTDVFGRRSVGVPARFDTFPVAAPTLPVGFFGAWTVVGLSAKQRTPACPGNEEIRANGEASERQRIQAQTAAAPSGGTARGSEAAAARQHRQRTMQQTQRAGT